MADRNQFYRDYFDISEYGEVPDIGELLQTEEKPVLKKTKQKRLKGRRTNTYITTDEDLLFTSRHLDERDVSHRPSANYFLFENVTRELREIGANRFTNETLENYYQSDVLSTEDDRDTTEEEEYLQEFRSPILASVPVPVAAPVSAFAPTPVQTEKPKTAVKKDRKKNNVFLASMKRLGKLNDNNEPVSNPTSPAIQTANSSPEIKTELESSSDEYASLRNDDSSYSGYLTATSTEALSSEERSKEKYRTHSKRLTGFVPFVNSSNRNVSLKPARSVRHVVNKTYPIYVPEIVNHEFAYKHSQFPSLS